MNYKEIAPLLKELGLGELAKEEIVKMKELESSPFELLFDEVEEVPIKEIISGKLVDEITKVTKEINREKEKHQRDIQNFIDEMIKKHKKPDNEVLTMDIYDSLNKKSKFSEDDIREYYDGINNELQLAIEVLKRVIDQKNYPTERKALIISDWNGEFWQSQDVLNLKQRAGFFRAKYGF
jgi:hypothetical protein